MRANTKKGRTPTHAHDTRLTGAGAAGGGAIVRGLACTT
jgi:hypothetical protein